MKQAFFISVEGIDGAGKSSHLDYIKNYLEESGYHVVKAREPGGTVVGESIRDLLLHSDVVMDRMTELFLLFASRQEIIRNVIKPNLDNGVCVLIDRYVDSTLAYQGYGRDIPIEKIDQLVDLLEPSLKPDLTFLFDVDLATAAKRLAKNNKNDRIEKEGGSFFAKVQHGYHILAKRDPQRIKLINTIQAKDDTRAELAAYLDNLMGK